MLCVSFVYNSVNMYDQEINNRENTHIYFVPKITQLAVKKHKYCVVLNVLSSFSISCR